ncbi:hypothetical protein B4113_3191 [Geobacillus sp. B4113_201601]|nr:hypothetical protein B4113_3191 [Geobacillus sp. B4113_201601]
MIGPIVSPPLAVQCSPAFFARRHRWRGWMFPFSTYWLDPFCTAIARAAFGIFPSRRGGRSFDPAMRMDKYTCSL